MVAVTDAAGKQQGGAPPSGGQGKSSSQDSSGSAQSREMNRRRLLGAIRTKLERLLDAHRSYTAQRLLMGRGDHWRWRPRLHEKRAVTPVPQPADRRPERWPVRRRSVDGAT